MPSTQTIHSSHNPIPGYVQVLKTPCLKSESLNVASYQTLHRQVQSPKTKSSSEAEQTASPFSKWVNDYSAQEQAHGDPYSHLDHAVSDIEYHAIDF